jgi:hypothetical protein
MSREETRDSKNKSSIWKGKRQLGHVAGFIAWFLGQQIIHSDSLWAG